MANNEEQQLTRKTIREWRESAFLTLGELAELVGVRLQTVWNWESGRSRPEVRNIRKLAKALGIDPRQIVLPIPKRLPTAA